MNRLQSTEGEVWDAINASEARMSGEELRFWDCIAVQPTKWKHVYYSGPCWLVAIMGRFVIWLDDVEGGFGLSEYATFGEIRDGGASQLELEMAVRGLMSMLAEGRGRRI